MDRMKRLASALLALCMLATATPLPAFAQPVEESLPTAAATQMADVSGSAPTEKPTAVPTKAAEALVSTEETTGTPTPVSTDETTGMPTPVPADETTGTPTPVPTDETTGTPTPVPTDEATGTPTPVPTDEATGTPTPVPTDAAEIKTIASFEAVAPEGLFAPQGTLETDLGLPVSLNAQFSDGAAGEVAVAWQCAAGYDPNAEAGTQFAFAAVLPEGYALAEGVSLPQILVTLTPPLANAMLAAQASDKGWTLSDDGTLTVTGAYLESNAISSWSDVKSIVVAASASLTLDTNASFSGNITVLADGSFSNWGNISGDTSVESGGVFANNGTISGGTFTGTVKNYGATISGGDFTGATFENYGAVTITGGTFSNIAFDRESKALTITGDVDLSNGGTLAPLTIGLDDSYAKRENQVVVFHRDEHPAKRKVQRRRAIAKGVYRRLPHQEIQEKRGGGPAVLCGSEP